MDESPVFPVCTQTQSSLDPEQFGCQSLSKCAFTVELQTTSREKGIVFTIPWCEPKHISI